MDIYGSNLPSLHHRNQLFSKTQSEKKLISLTKRFLGEENIGEGANPLHPLKDVYVKQIVVDELWESVTFFNQDWKSLDSFCLNNTMLEGADNGDCNEKVNERLSRSKFEDVLHGIADSLPYAGCIIDVILLWTEHFTKASNFTAVFGALRRLTDWHNAQIIVDNHGISEALLATVDLLHASVIENEENLCMDKKCFWRGKLSITDKVENKSLICPGFMLKFMEDGLCSNVSRLKLVPNVEAIKFGRMLEVLDEVDLVSIPSYLISNKRINLCLYSEYPQSRMVLDYMTDIGNEVGLIARLPFHTNTEDACKDHNLNTSFWKENIMADISYVQEPEEDILNGTEYLHVVLTSSDDPAHLTVTVLRSPDELNGELFQKMYQHSLLPTDRNDGDIKQTLCSLPHFNISLLNYISDDLRRIQSQLLRDWIDSKETSSRSIRVSMESLMKYLGEVETIYLNYIKKELPCTELDGNPTEVSTTSYSELDVPPSNWPERLALVYQESQRRALTRLQSSESVPLSSPIRPTKTSTTVDVQDFLNYFHPDGTASRSGISPLRCHKTSRALSKNVAENPADVSWPQCKDTLFHDIYYNKDRKSEKYEQHYVKVQNRYVSEETYSSCNSTTITLPKKSKNKITTNEEDILKSPNRKSSRLEAKELSSKRSSLSRKPSFDQKKDETKRRTSESFGQDALKSLASSQSRTKSLSSDKITSSEIFKEPSGQPSNRRKSTSVTKHESTTPIGVKSKGGDGEIQTTSTPLSQKEKKENDSSQTKKESRSQRHKRKLESICDEALAANGIDKSNEMYKSCANKLFKVTKLFVMDLPNSRNLSEEMRKIAESQVKQVIDVERRRSSMG